jgi:hypothetical protein
MLFCFPFLWSSNIADLVGAGFPFVAGAILTIGGLINLSILSRPIQIENSIRTRQATNGDRGKTMARYYENSAAN